MGETKTRDAASSRGAVAAGVRCMVQHPGIRQIGALHPWRRLNEKVKLSPNNCREFRVTWVIDHGGWLAAMAVLMLCSAFFSASEAALFYLNRRAKRAFETGNAAQRVAAGLLSDPDRLLTAVLFWNLAINMAYFSIVSIVGLQMASAAASLFSVIALMTMMFVSEMLPKSLGVLRPRLLSTVVAVPLAFSVRTVDPLIGVFRLTVLLTQRLLWPKFRPEPYLQINDLERAVQLSTTDAALLAQEQTVLQNIVSLSEIRADELMRPRTQFRSFRPPVAAADLNNELPRSGYVLVTEADNDEIAAAIPIAQLSELPDQHLEHYAEDIVYVPWCTPVADALEEMQLRDRRVAAVINEYGETIGVLTHEDILATIFASSPSRSSRLLKREPIHQVAPGVWNVTGITGLRRLARHFDLPTAASKSVTVGGVVQEQLERLPRKGDFCRWGPFQLEVLEASQRGPLLIQLTLAADAEAPT